MNAITIHNVNGPHPTADVNLYCGRNGSQYPWLVNAGLGNPFPMKGEADREMVCEDYGSFLRLSLPDSPLILRIKRIAELVREGKTVSLSCHCSPKRCHCDTIKAEVSRILWDSVRNPDWDEKHGPTQEELDVVFKDHPYLKTL